MNYPLRTALGFIVRLLVIAPFALLLAPLSTEAAALNNNIGVFMLIVMATATIIYLCVMIFVPAEYCIRTAIDIIEFHSYKPQAIMVHISATIALLLTFAMAAFALYWTGIVLLLYAGSLYTWPRYILRIDAASKDAMMTQLGANKAA
jgi:uncharacterized membrane protein YidH (DUF202 family)